MEKPKIKPKIGLKCGPLRVSGCRFESIKSFRINNKVTGREPILFLCFSRQRRLIPENVSLNSAGAS